MISYAGISVYSDGMQSGMIVYVGILHFSCIPRFSHVLDIFVLHEGV